MMLERILLYLLGRMIDAIWLVAVVSVIYLYPAAKPIILMYHYIPAP